MREETLSAETVSVPTYSLNQKTNRVPAVLQKTHPAADGGVQFAIGVSETLSSPF
jgi:hypothetical protein